MIDAEQSHFSRLNCFAEHECWKEMEIIIVFKKKRLIHIVLAWAIRMKKSCFVR